MLFSPALLRQQLLTVNQAKVLWVAFSGGMDSAVLLHACHKLVQDSVGMPAMRAIHVNHGLSPYATDWQAHCQHQCELLGVPLQTYTLQVVAQPGEKS
jgi:tRNA(Ile)-lysidine synthase